MKIDSKVRIVVAPDGLPVERHASEELQRYIFEMSGVKLLIADVPVKGRSNIYIGTAASSAGLDLSEAALGFDGYIVKTVGKDLILTGIKPYSCLYAVYHLLERHLGCGFFEDGDQVPKQATVEIGEINDVEKPRFERRIYAMFHPPAYSGMHWYNWDQWKQFFDWVIKKRFNMCETNRLTDYVGIAALAATRMGVPIELTPWQKEQLALMRRLFDYGRMNGIRFVYNGEYYKPWLTNEPGSMPYYDLVQIEEFIRRYKELTGEEIPIVTYKWWGPSFPWMDPRHPATQKFVTTCVKVLGEVLGTDHFYMCTMTGEGYGFAIEDQEELNQVTYSMLIQMIGAVKAGDPEANICTRGANPYGKDYEAAKRAVRDARLPIVADFFLDQPGRMHDFLMCDYFWGLPWATGMIVECGKETNPWGDLELAINNAKQLIADPRADKCMGFLIAGESNHRNYIKEELYAALSWNPAEVEKEDFLRRWTVCRYGPDVAERLYPAIKHIANTLLANVNRDLMNRPQYRSWGSNYLPGLVPVSVKRTMSYLPRLRSALEILLSEHDKLKDISMYRFDLVDYGRTYLGALFNDALARARKALRKGDKDSFEKHAARVEEIMHFMAKYCSAHEQFRLKTYDDWASRHKQILPGHDNAESNWITFTACMSPTFWSNILDYMAEDHAELVEHYFWPRVKLYLQKMRELLEAGKDISGRLVSRGTTDSDMPYRISDWATPQGKLPWSPYGTNCEPELMTGDLELAHQIIMAGTVSGKFNFYNGPMDKLVRELLDRFPLPEDLDAILAEADIEGEAVKRRVLDGKPGEVFDGFHVPGVVEQVRVPKELSYLVDVKTVSEEYNVARGNIASYTVDVSDYLKLTRLPDEKASIGDHQVAVFEFEAIGRNYVLHYDSGSDVAVAKLFIDLAK